MGSFPVLVPTPPPTSSRPFSGACSFLHPDFPLPLPLGGASAMGRNWGAIYWAPRAPSQVPQRTEAQRGRREGKGAEDRECKGEEEGGGFLPLNPPPRPTSPASLNQA